MKRLSILTAFEREINKLDDAINKPYTDDSLYWLNQAIAKFVKERFNGNAPHYTSYEQNEKRLRDLIGLEKRETLVPTQLSFPSETQGEGYLQFVYKEPEDLMFTLQDRVTINDLGGGYPYTTATFECTNDSLMYRMTNSLTDFHYKHHKARPLRLRTREAIEGSDELQNVVILYTDGKYVVDNYVITYLRKPQVLTDENPEKNPEYTDFNDHVWLEIIKIAAQMYVENQSDPRYKTLTNEVLTQE